MPQLNRTTVFVDCVMVMLVSNLVLGVFSLVFAEPITTKVFSIFFVVVMALLLQLAGHRMEALKRYHADWSQIIAHDRITRYRRGLEYVRDMSWPRHLFIAWFNVEFYAVWGFVKLALVFLCAAVPAILLFPFWTGMAATSPALILIGGYLMAGEFFGAFPYPRSN